MTLPFVAGISDLDLLDELAVYLILDRVEKDTRSTYTVDFANYILVRPSYLFDRSSLCKSVQLKNKRVFFCAPNYKASTAVHALEVYC